MSSKATLTKWENNHVKAPTCPLKRDRYLTRSSEQTSLILWIKSCIAMFSIKFSLLASSLRTSTLQLNKEILKKNKTTPHYIYNPFLNAYIPILYKSYWEIHPKYHSILFYISIMNTGQYDSVYLWYSRNSFNGLNYILKRVRTFESIFYHKEGEGMSLIIFIRDIGRKQQANPQKIPARHIIRKP